MIKLLTFIFLTAFTNGIHLTDQYAGAYEQAGPPAQAIREIEQAIVEGDSRAVAKFFDKQVFLTLLNKEGAYYSSNQAVYILESFFHSNKVASFKFSSTNMESGSAYATGAGRIKAKGTRSAIQIYVSLIKSNDRWVISQFNVY